MKTAKKTLITSIVAIVICLSLVAGATYAWFIKTSPTNIAVTSGTVDVSAVIDVTSLQLHSLVKGKQQEVFGQVDTTDNPNYKVIKTFETGGTASIDKDDKLVLDNIVPGDKADFVIEITNKSTISIKYRVKVGQLPDGLAKALVITIKDSEKNNIAGKWSEVIAPPENVAVGEIKTVNVSIELPDTVTQYQGETVELEFFVEAIQANADVVDEVVVSSSEEITDAAKQDNFDITLAGEIELEDESLTFVGTGVLDLNGHSITNAQGQSTITVADGATLTIEDSSDDYGTIVNTSAKPTILVEDGGAVHIKGGTVINNSTKPSLYVEPSATAVIDGGTFLRDDKAGSNHYTIENYGEMTINDGTFYHESGDMEGTITLVANKNGGTMEINGGTYGGMNVAIKNERAELVINGGTFDAIGNDSGDNLAQSIQNQGNATINGGTFEKMIANIAQVSTDRQSEYVGVLTINGGTFNDRVRSQKITDVEKDKEGNVTNRWTPKGTPTITIEGGTFNKNLESEAGAKIEIFYGTFYAGLAGAGDYFISGGRFTNKPSSDRIVPGHITNPTPNDDGTYNVIEGNPIVRYNSLDFAHFEDVLAYMKYYGKEASNGTIELAANVTDNLILPSGYSVQLSMKGFNITSAKDQHTILVGNGASLTLTTKGSVTNNATDKAALYIEQNGNVVIKGNNLTFDFNTNYHSIVNLGTLTLGYSTTGTNANNNFTAQYTGESDSNLIVNEATMYIYGGIYVGNIVATTDSQTTFTGGTINGNTMLSGLAKISNTYNATTGVVGTVPTFNGAFTASVNTTISGGKYKEQPNDSNIVAGYKTVFEDEIYVVRCGVLLIINGEMSPIESLEKVFDYLQTESITGAVTIALQQNAETNIDIPANLVVTLSLNGNTLSNATENHTVTVLEGGSLTVSSDGFITNDTANKSAIHVSKGSLTVSKGTITHEAENGSAITVEEGNTIKISGGTINGNVTINCSAPSITNGSFNGNVSITSDTVTISGGKFANKLDITSDKIILTGGTYDDVDIDASVSTSIAKDTVITFNGNLTISGGDVTIVGAFSVTNRTAYLKAVAFNGAVTIKNAGKVTISGGTYQKPVSITGDSVEIKNTPTNVSKGILSIVPEFADTVTINSDDITVTDGVFANDPSGWLDEEYTAEESDGVFTVKKKD